MVYRTRKADYEDHRTREHSRGHNVPSRPKQNHTLADLRIRARCNILVPIVTIHRYQIRYQSRNTKNNLFFERRAETLGAPTRRVERSFALWKGDPESAFRSI